jgi:hypothetical protein
MFSLLDVNTNIYQSTLINFFKRNIYKYNDINKINTKTKIFVAHISENNYKY